MPVLRLRNHIPIGAPARREPADGTEAPLRVSLGFEPAWFYVRCGVDLSERWHTDPCYRHDALATMKAALCRAFPEVDYWDENKTEDLWTLSGCYGAYVVPALFGCTLGYAPDRWPVIASRPAMDLAALADLDADALLQGALVADLERQMDTIEAEGGMIHGYLNWQGILNNAFNVMGQQVFVEMGDRPQLVHRLLALICEVMIRLAQQVQQRQRASGFEIDQLDVSNCVMNMISPRSYRDYVFPYDKSVAESFRWFGVHTCNWDVTPYLEVLRELPNVGYLDMGMMSDMRRARDLFPEARRAVLYSPVTLHEASKETIARDMARIYQDLAPCDVVMADIRADTPDDRVCYLLQACRDLENGTNPWQS